MGGNCVNPPPRWSHRTKKYSRRLITHRNGQAPHLEALNLRHQGPTCQASEARPPWHCPLYSGYSGNWHWTQNLSHFRPGPTRLLLLYHIVKVHQVHRTSPYIIILDPNGLCILCWGSTPPRQCPDGIFPASHPDCPYHG